MYRRSFIAGPVAGIAFGTSGCLHGSDDDVRGDDDGGDSTPDGDGYPEADQEGDGSAEEADGQTADADADADGDAGGETADDSAEDTGEVGDDVDGVLSVPASGDNYETLTYEVTEVDEYIFQQVGYTHNAGSYTLNGKLMVGENDCFTSGLTDITVTGELLEVWIQPVERDGAAESCSGPIVEHQFEVRLDYTVPGSVDRILIKADDYEDGEITVYDSAD